jgi:hypothetical protein
MRFTFCYSPDRSVRLLARSTINDATAPITVRRSRQVQEAPVQVAECSGEYDQDGSRIEGRNRDIVDHNLPPRA